MKIAVIDTGAGNLGSVRQAFARVGAPVCEARSPSDIGAANMLVMPGVGAFADGMDRLTRQGLVEPIREFARDGGVVLGICLGMQLLAEEGHEHERRRGLGLIHGRVVPLQPTSASQRVPNIGWCDVTVARHTQWLQSTRDRNCFYFAHSFWLDSDDDALVTATIDWGDPVTAAVECGNIIGLQFHPEKSQDSGLNLLTSIVERAAKQLSLFAETRIA